MRYHQRPQFDENAICVLDIETISSEKPEDGSFPPWCTHTPVVASLLTACRDSVGRWAFELESVRFSDPEEALERIDERLNGKSLVAFNSRGFDVPVLMMTAQKARVFSLPSLTAAANEPRYNIARHYDLADKISGYGAARGASLERLCTALQIPVKLAAHGSEVGDMYDRGEIEAIEAYCSGDVASTLLAFAYYRAMETGDAGYHASLTWQFARWADEQCRDYLAPYAEVRNGVQLQRLSLLDQIDCHFENARLNANLREQRAVDAEFGEVTPF